MIIDISSFIGVRWKKIYRLFNFIPYNKTAKKDKTWMHAIEIISAIVSQTQNNESSRMFLS